MLPGLVAVAVSGLGLSDLPVGMNIPSPQPPIFCLPASPGSAPNWALEQKVYEGNCDHEHEAWPGRQ